MLDTIIEAKNWPEDFPMGFRLIHSPHLMLKLEQEYEWIDNLEEQWKPESEPNELDLPKGVYKVDSLPNGLYEMNVCSETISKGNRLWEIIGLTEEGMAVVKDITNETKQDVT